MNNIYSEIGGRPRKTDDLLLVQEEASKATSAILRHLHDAKGGFILKGCVPAQNGTISAGMIYLNYEFLEFDGATNVTYPAKLGIKEELTNDLQYEDGGVKPTRKRRYASLDTDADFTVSLTISPIVYQELNDLLVKTYGDQAIDGNKLFRNEIILKGLNVYDKLTSLTNAISTAVSNLTTYVDGKIATVNQSITNLTNAITNKADKQQLTWIDVQPASGWMCYPTEQLQVAKDQFGMVYVRGTINPVSYNSNPVFGLVGTIATLPVGYRPARTQQYVIWESGAFFGALNMNANGEIEGYNGGSTSIPRFVIDYKIFALN